MWRTGTAIALGAVGLLGAAAAPAASVRYRLEVTVEAGPTCPVERIPPDPGCAPRPVAGARLVIARAGRPGSAAALLVTDDHGRARARLPAGRYVLAPLRGPGLLRAPPSRPFTLPGRTRPLRLLLSYDTGIR